MILLFHSQGLQCSLLPPDIWRDHVIGLLLKTLVTQVFPHRDEPWCHMRKSLWIDMDRPGEAQEGTEDLVNKTVILSLF